MKYKKKKANLERKISHFLSDRTIQQCNAESPGTYHKPGNLKK